MGYLVKKKLIYRGLQFINTYIGALTSAFMAYGIRYKGRVRDAGN